MTPQEAIDSLGLKIRATFVPFSKSRNKDKPLPSLNWKVTLVRVHGADNEAGRDVLTTDYMAGAGLCPSCNIKPPASWDRPPRMWQSLAIAWECENGRRAAWTSYSGFSKAGAAKPIEPNPLDVIHSLVMDAGVLDEGTFEDWASALGYDPDSRKAEAIWKACIEIALQLRGAIGDAGMETLRTAFEDY